MKKLILIPLMSLTLAACGNDSKSAETAPAGVDVKALQAEIESLKTEIDGGVLGTCEGDAILANSEAYGDVLKNLPDTKLESEKWHAANAERDDVMVTQSGLQYSVVQKGTADSPKPAETHMVKVNYHGMFTDGKKFDSSYDRGKPSEFPRNGVIKGWIEALGDMQPCEARTLYIPGKLAYGDQGRPGSIPPNATLIFNVQLLDVRVVGLKEKLEKSKGENNQLMAFINQMRAQQQPGK